MEREEMTAMRTGTVFSSAEIKEGINLVGMKDLDFVCGHLRVQ